MQLPAPNSGPRFGGAFFCEGRTMLAPAIMLECACGRRPHPLYSGPAVFSGAFLLRMPRNGGNPEPSGPVTGEHGRADRQSFLD
jgi:hypothetical protein